MASGFCKICYSTDRNDTAIVFDEFVSYFELNGVQLIDKKGDVEYVMEKGGLTQISFKMLREDLLNGKSVAFFLKVSQACRLYVRFLQTYEVVIEEYDLSWMPDEDARSFIYDLLVKRMTNLIYLKNIHFYGGVIDKAGYSEEFDWIDFIRFGSVEITEVPTILCTTFSNAAIGQFIQKVEELGEYKMIYFD